VNSAPKISTGWVNYDPEAIKQLARDHQATIAYLAEAREEIARPKRRSAELAALVERSIRLLSATGE
jgi:hypothetical protein